MTGVQTCALPISRARAAGVQVRVTTRCASGRVVGTGEPQATGAAQARVELWLELLLQRRRRAAAASPSAPSAINAALPGSGTGVM